MSWRRALALAALVLAGNWMGLWLTLRAINEQVDRQTRNEERAVKRALALVMPEVPREITGIWPGTPAVQPPQLTVVDDFEPDPELDPRPAWAMGLSDDEYLEMMRDQVDPTTGRPLR